MISLSILIFSSLQRPQNNGRGGINSGASSHKANVSSSWPEGNGEGRDGGKGGRDGRDGEEEEGETGRGMKEGGKREKEGKKGEGRGEKGGGK